MLGALLFSLAVNAAPLPAELDLTVHFVEASTPVSLKDTDGSTVTVWGATIAPVQITSNRLDFLNLRGAASRSFVSPAIGKCIFSDYSFDVLGPATELFMLSSREPKGVTACADFIRRASSEGMVVDFTGVPLNRPGAVVKRVRVRLGNP